MGGLPGVGEDENEQKKIEKKLSIRKEGPADPHAAGLGGSLSSAALGIVKGMVGPAILYLPHGFAAAGYLVAVPVLALSTMLFLWSSACLLDSWKVESDRANLKRPNKRNMLSYPELAYRAFGSGGEKLVQVGISLMQSGVCLTYLIFVPQNLSASARLLLGWDVSTDRTLALMMAAQIPFSWIRDIRRLTVTNLLANVLILYGLITCLGFAATAIGSDLVDGGADSSDSFGREVYRRAQTLPAFNPSGWFLFLGTSVLLFEGSITLLVPLQEAVATPSDRDKFPVLYRRVITGIVAFYAFFGISCWMAFGDDVRTVMTTSLPPGTTTTSVQLAYSLAVAFTFPLQNFPSLEIVAQTVERMLSTRSGESGTKTAGHNKRGDGVQRNVISTILIVALSIIAKAAMNNLDKVVSLMGSLLGCPLAFVIPPLIQNRLLDEKQLPGWKRSVNKMVAALGVSAMAISSTTTIMNWE